MTQDFPPAIMAMLRECADRNGTEYTGPWEGPNGEPLQDDAEAAIAWIEARASLAQPASVPADGIDYEKLVADAWSLHKYRCGTPTCIAFKNGAEWQAKQAPQPAQAKSRQQEIINSIKSALIRHEAATDAVVATAAGDDPHAATLAGIELEKAAALLATWTQPEYLRVLLAADPAQPAQAAEDQAAHDNAILERGIQIGMLRQREIAGAPQPEAQPDERFDWSDFLAISEAREVDEAIRALLENHDEDNAVCMVRAVIEEAGERLVRLSAPSAQAEPPGKNWHAHHVAVNKGALQMIRNALRTDAEAGKKSRAEMLEELDKATFTIPKQAEQGGK